MANANPSFTATMATSRKPLFMSNPTVFINSECHEAVIVMQYPDRMSRVSLSKAVHMGYVKVNRGRFGMSELEADTSIEIMSAKVHIYIKQKEIPAVDMEKRNREIQEAIRNADRERYQS